MSKVDPDYEVDEKHSWVRTLGENANRDMGIRADQVKGRAERGEKVGYSAAALSTELASETEEQSLAAYSEGLEATGTSAEDPEIRSDLLAYDERIKQILADKVKENADLMILDTEEQIAQLPQDQKTTMFQWRLSRLKQQSPCKAQGWGITGLRHKRYQESIGKR
jgi:hypothetical protein